jgi:hypothetical protein
MALGEAGSLFASQNSLELPSAWQWQATMRNPVKAPRSPAPPSSSANGVGRPSGLDRAAEKGGSH